MSSGSTRWYQKYRAHSPTHPELNKHAYQRRGLSHQHILQTAEILRMFGPPSNFVTAIDRTPVAKILGFFTTALASGQRVKFRAFS